MKVPIIKLSIRMRVAMLCLCMALSSKHLFAQSQQISVLAGRAYTIGDTFYSNWDINLVTGLQYRYQSAGDIVFTSDLQYINGSFISPSPFTLGVAHLNAFSLRAGIGKVVFQKNITSIIPTIGMAAGQLRFHVDEIEHAPELSNYVGGYLNVLIDNRLTDAVSFGFSMNYNFGYGLSNYGLDIPYNREMHSIGIDFVLSYSL